MMHSPVNIEAFIERWAASDAAERANYQLFLTELCALIEVPPPEPTRPDDAGNAYVERLALPTAIEPLREQWQAVYAAAVAAARQGDLPAARETVRQSDSELTWTARLQFEPHAAIKGNARNAFQIGPRTVR